jgi:hypothetical protein
MHLFGHNLDHDYYFELPREGERDTQSISRCSTSHHGDFRAVPCANRIFSTARNPIPGATSSTSERPVCGYAMRSAWLWCRAPRTWLPGLFHFCRFIFWSRRRHSVSETWQALRLYSVSRVGGGALARWPPSAAQTVRADFRHTAFTKTPADGSENQEKVLERSG